MPAVIKVISEVNKYSIIFIIIFVYKLHTFWGGGGGLNSKKKKKKEFVFLFVIYLGPVFLCLFVDHRIIDYRCMCVNNNNNNNNNNNHSIFTVNKNWLFKNKNT